MWQCRRCASAIGEAAASRSGYRDALWHHDIERRVNNSSSALVDVTIGLIRERGWLGRLGRADDVRAAQSARRAAQRRRKDTRAVSVVLQHRLDLICDVGRQSGFELSNQVRALGVQSLTLHSHTALA